MIKNERQYRITKAQARRFEQALADLEDGSAERAPDPLLFKAQKDAVQSQLADLVAQLDEYEALVSGKLPVIEVESLEGLPRALIQARIASGLTQKELAERLGIQEQQVQRYEASDYEAASLTRLIQVSGALGLKVRQDIVLPHSRVSLGTLWGRIKTVGLDRAFVLRRLAPVLVRAHLEARPAGEVLEDDVAALQIAGRLSRVFGWTSGEIFGASPLRLSAANAGLGGFKVPARTDQRRLCAYTVYARFLAGVLLQATAHLSPRAVPAGADQVCHSVVSSYGSLTLEHALRYVWDLGTPVLPLVDGRAFHGACWRMGGRNVMVLKQNTSSAARWLFDLLHELWHAAQRPDQGELAVIEVGEDGGQRRPSPEEEAANRFAGDVVLGGRSEELAGLCLRAARGRLANLRGAVARVASREGVPVDALANYMAFHLSRQGEDWWGAAANLQPRGGAPWRTARDVLLERVNLGRLSEVDRELLVQALAENVAEG